ncbi:pyridoxal phosphate-dependent decarboxylase family protein [Salinibacterium hongtaonis]|uniref:pyridoxal phosphate-dependent decarboxylase family protein n=1 Tax=Homoserinimonas hongtaonis TaxID=2079791 RepID=UPI000D377B5E|nr:aminotransferase class V-fold PLP-dependent enzyme [Salinibacterium hongtaonis]AWB88770.1 aspartate aminotransferase family protein [Salinibacterium hongtaonis]
MNARQQPADGALEAVLGHARRWLTVYPERAVPATGSADDAAERLGRQLAAHGAPTSEVVDRLVAAVEPGLMASGSGRFYGWVMGGTLPAALAADWLVSVWDQNAGMRDSTPGVVAAEEIAAAWILDVLSLPSDSGVGFVTGATMANFTCLAAARDAVLAERGWDVAQRGLVGSPGVRVLVGEESHGSVELALRYLGLGVPDRIGADEQGRMLPSELESAIATAPDMPTVVCLQAGNIHSGAFDPFESLVEMAHRAGAWVHVDGAFGLWAAATPTLAHLTAGLGRADSWATDAHKTLNTPYDCGIAVVSDAARMRASMGIHASYLLTASTVDPYELVPELSRRARGVPVWAALASLGRDGVAELVEGLVAAAQAIAQGLGELSGVTVLNDVVYSQVTCACASDAHTRAVFAAIIEEGVIMPSLSAWRERVVIRFSVSSWRTGPDDVVATVDAVARALSAVSSRGGEESASSPA